MPRVNQNLGHLRATRKDCTDLRPRNTDVGHSNAELAGAASVGADILIGA